MKRIRSSKEFAILALFAYCAIFFVGCGAVGSGLPPKPTPAPVTWVDELYVSESGLNRVESLDVTTGKSLATIPVGVRPTMMVYDHHTVNLWDNYSDPAAALWVLNAGSASVTRIDPRTSKAVATIAIGGSPIDIATAQNTSHLLYVADGQSNSVAIVNEDYNSIVGHITTAARPTQMSANAAVLMIAESNNSVELFDDTKQTSTTPIATITTQAALVGVGTYFDTDPAIETADGMVHIYKPQALGGLPWTNVANYKLPHGAGRLEGILGNNYMVIDAGAKLVQYLAFDGNGNFVDEHDMPTGVQPGFSSEGSSSDGTGYFYIPNTGGDSLSVYYRLWLPYGSWPLTAGSHPSDTVALEFQQSSSPTPSATPSAAPTATPTASPTPAPTATPAAIAHMYVANGSGKNVLEYTAPFSASSAPSVTVNIGANVWGVAVDRSYVAVEDSTGFIYIFNAPLAANASPVAQFQGPVNGANLLFDSNGNLYTGTQGAGVLEYSPPFSNSSTPSKTITGDSSSFSLAMDMISNTLYVGNLGSNQIDVFASPYTGAPTSVTSPGTYSLATQGSTLYGADAMSNAIDAYNLPMNGSSTPAYIITATNPHALAFDNSDGTLYVGDQNGSIDAFAQPLGASSTKAFSFTNGVVEPVEISIDN